MIQLQHLAPQHWPEVKAIYESGIATQNATLETQAPDWEAWDKAHLRFGRLVATQNENVLGWAALSAVSSRCVYGGVAEVSVYIAPESRGKGVGVLLLQMLVTESEQNGIWTLQSGILRENQASIQLHQKCGFRMIGFREKIGKLNGVWRDVVLMERRSALFE